MKKLDSKWLILVAVVALAAVGASVALASHQSKSPQKQARPFPAFRPFGKLGAGRLGQAGPALAAERDAFLADLAKRLGVSTDQLKQAVKGAVDDRIDAAVTAGELTKAEGDALKQEVDSSQGPLFGAHFSLGAGMGGLGVAGVMRLRHGRGHMGQGRGPFAEVLKAAAGYLGLSEPQLREKLRAGESLAQVAKEQQKSLDGLKQAVTNAVKSRLAQAVENGRLSQAQADKLLTALTANLDQLLNGSFMPLAGPQGP